MKRYFKVQWKKEETFEEVVCVETNETGDVSDRVSTPTEHKNLMFGEDAGTWEIDELDEITEAEARKEVGRFGNEESEFPVIPVMELLDE